MARPKRPLPGHSIDEQEPDTDAQAQKLADLALAIVEDEEGNPEALREHERELLAAVRRALRRQHDDVLYGAIEIARDTDPHACRHLSAVVEEQAATLRVRREGAPEYEVDCFLIPVFVRSAGGLAEAEEFVDDAAFEALSASFKPAGLDSKDARVVLVRHAYDLSEIDRIGYGTLQRMLAEAAASMTSKKLAPAPTLEASVRGWSAGGFAPDEEAMELRFLLGFSGKRADDPFYQVPEDEAQADDWFAARMDRYRAWSAAAAPLVARCLARDPDRVAISFLYQDLFYGAKAQAVSELAILATLSQIHAVLEEKQLAADRVHAVVAPVGQGGQALLRVNLYAVDGGPPWATLDKPADSAADLSAEVDELCDALLSHGIEGVSVADGFAADGHPQGARPFEAG